MELEDYKRRCNAQTKAGQTVRFVAPTAGWDHDIDYAAKHLVVGDTYLVTYVQVQPFRTDLSLAGKPGRFNSVQFEPVG